MFPVPPLSHTFPVLGIVSQGSISKVFISNLQKKYPPVLIFLLKNGDIDNFVVRNGHWPQNRQNTIATQSENVKKHQKT